MNIKIEEAIARAKESGRRVLKKDIAARIWPDGTPEARQVNMTKLLKGRTLRIEPEWVKIICEMTGVSADFLFGMSNE